MRHRIAWKLTAIWLAVALPLAALLALTYYQWYSTRVRLVEQERTGYARLSAAAFGLLITEMQRTMETAGRDVQGLSPGDPRASDELRGLTALYPADYAVIADTSGKVVQASRADLVGTSMTGDHAFLFALAGGPADGIEPSTVTSDGVGFHVAHRFETKGATPAGVMLMFVDVSKLHRFFPIDVPVGGISVIDSTGQVVYQSEDAGLALRREQWSRFPFVLQALDGEIGLVREWDFPLGGRRIGAFVPLEPLGWAAGSSVDAGVSLAPFFRSMRMSLPIAIAVIVLGATGSVIISRSITISLRVLAEDSRRIGSGTLDEPVRTSRTDEIGDVARSLEGARRSLAGYAEENARLFEEQRQAAALGRALGDIDALLHSTLSFREILARVVELAAHAIGCDAAGVNLREGEEWVRAAVFGIPEEYLDERMPDDRNAIATLVADTGSPVIIEDAARDDRVEPWFAERYGIASGMAFPLFARGKVVGTLFFFYRGAPVRFGETQIDFARKLSRSLSLAYENARLYTAQHDIAETLQTAMLALPESLPGIRTACAYRSATEAARVGGDFYDVFGIAHDRVAITVGDISGHGIDAAVLTSLVRNAIRVNATEVGRRPSEVLAAANTVLYRNSADELFATVFFGVLDPWTGEFEYCNAGHTAGALLTVGGPSSLVPNSPIVGAFPEVDYSDATVRVSEGDVLFLYTDGLIEARLRGEQYGQARLFELLAAERDADLDTIVDRAMTEVLAFTGGALSDDVAVLALRRTLTS